MSDPPFLLPGAGAGALRNSHLRNTPWGGRSRLIDPCGKAPAKIPENLLWQQIGELRERMAHLDALLEGLCEAITRPPVA